MLLNVEDDLQKLVRENASLRKSNQHLKHDVESILREREEIIETAEKRDRELSTLIQV